MANNYSYYTRMAGNLSLLAGRIQNGEMHPVPHDIRLLQECANLILRLAQIEDIVMERKYEDTPFFEIVKALYPVEEDV